MGVFLIFGLFIIVFLFLRLRQQRRVSKSRELHQEAQSTASVDMEPAHPYRKALEIISPAPNLVVPAGGFVVKKASWRKTLYGCGHRASKKFKLVILSENYALSEDFFEARPMCPSCLHRQTIRCATCGSPILPGEPVGRYIASGDEEPWSTHCADNPRCVIHCMLASCPESGAGYCGTWNGESIDFAFRAKS